MEVGFGKYAAEDVRRVLLNRPDYVKWALEQGNPGGKSGVFIGRLCTYISTFDAKPFTKNCMGEVVAPNVLRPSPAGPHTIATAA